MEGQLQEEGSREGGERTHSYWQWVCSLGGWNFRMGGGGRKGVQSVKESAA